MAVNVYALEYKLWNCMVKAPKLTYLHKMYSDTLVNQLKWIPHNQNFIAHSFKPIPDTSKAVDFLLVWKDFIPFCETTGIFLSSKCDFILTPRMTTVCCWIPCKTP